MKARRGQVVVYLALALLAIVVLTLMNVGAYLAVSAKNRTMNAGSLYMKNATIFCHISASI